MSANNPTRAVRKRVWAAENVVVNERLSQTARTARWIAVPLLIMQLLAVIVVLFRPFHQVALLLARFDLALYLAVVLAIVVGGGCAYASAQVWRDVPACGRKMSRLHLVGATLLTCLPAVLIRPLVADALDAVLDPIYGSGLQSASDAMLLPMLACGVLLQATLLWLLIRLPLSVVRHLSMVITTVEDQPSSSDDADAEDESESKAPSLARFAPSYALAFAAWAIWLAFFQVGLI